MTDTVGSTEFPEVGPLRGVTAVIGPTLNAIFAPTKAFEALAQRPVLACWPIIWVTALMMVLGVVNFEITRQIWRVATIEAMAQRGQNINAEQIRTMLEMMDRWAPVSVFALNLSIILTVGVFAVFIWMGTSIMGGSTQFSLSFVVASIAAVIHPLLTTAFVTLVWCLDPPQIRRVADFMQSTPTLGLGLLFSRELHPSLAQVVLRVDVFNVWWMALVVIGGERLLSLKRGSAMMLSIALWGLSMVLIGFWTSFNF